MKLKLLMILTVMSVLICLSACSAGPSLEVSCDEFGKNNHIKSNIEVSTGETFTVTLCSNPTTGFQWQETAEIGDQSILQQTNHEYIAPQGNTPAVGASGVEKWTFKALKNGNTTVSMEYGRPWEGGEKGEWTYELTVDVK